MFKPTYTRCIYIVTAIPYTLQFIRNLQLLYLYIVCTRCLMFKAPHMSHTLLLLGYKKYMHSLDVLVTSNHFRFPLVLFHYPTYICTCNTTEASYADYQCGHVQHHVHIFVWYMCHVCYICVIYVMYASWSILDQCAVNIYIIIITIDTHSCVHIYLPII